MEGGGGSSEGSGKDSDGIVAAIASTIQERMPEDFDLRKGHTTTFSKNGKSGQMNSLGVFLSQELVRFNQLMKVISTSLKMLQKAIKGFVVMSNSLELIYNCFLLQRVPEEWEKAGYPCLKPLASWTEDFFARLDFMRRWLFDGPPKSYWISGFFFPQGFMTAVNRFLPPPPSPFLSFVGISTLYVFFFSVHFQVKQTHSRTYSIAVDILKVGCKFTTHHPQEILSSPNSGVYIHGLFMEGGRVDRKTCKMDESVPGEVRECISRESFHVLLYARQYVCFDTITIVSSFLLSHSQLFDQMPVVQLIPELEKDYDSAYAGCYMCPLYKTSRRAGTLSTTGHSTNFVAVFPVASDLGEDVWVCRGCAMLCMLDY